MLSRSHKMNRIERPPTSFPSAAKVDVASNGCRLSIFSSRSFKFSSIVQRLSAALRALQPLQWICHPNQQHSDQIYSSGPTPHLGRRLTEKMRPPSQTMRWVNSLPLNSAAPAETKCGGRESLGTRQQNRKKKIAYDDSVNCSAA